MTKDCYAILGVRRTASQAIIREAYLRLVRENHPDLKPDDEAARQKFMDIQAAFEVLGDVARRGQYDRRSQPHPPRPLTTIGAVRQVSDVRGTSYSDVSIPSCMRAATISWCAALSLVLVMLVFIQPVNTRATDAKSHSSEWYDWAWQTNHFLLALPLFPTVLYGVAMFVLVIGVLVNGSDQYDWEEGSLVFAGAFVGGCALLLTMLVWVCRCGV